MADITELAKGGGGVDETASHQELKAREGRGPIPSGIAWPQIGGRKNWWRSPKEGRPEEGSLRSDLRGKALQSKAKGLGFP